jgi:chaperonin GroES
MDYTVLYDRVLIKPIEENKTLSSGIVLVAEQKSTTTTGTVIAIGDGKQYDNGKIIPLTVQVDDNVLFMKNTGIPTKLDGVEYLILRESEILGIIE